MLLMLGRDSAGKSTRRKSQRERERGRERERERERVGGKREKRQLDNYASIERIQDLHGLNSKQYRNAFPSKLSL